MRREAADLAYYFHWPLAEILSLSGAQRRAWLEEITRIHLMQKKAREKEAGEQIAMLLAARAERS